MLLYKTTCIPSVPYADATKDDFQNGLSVDTANRALAPVGKAIEEEARGGWTLHSISNLPQHISRKKTFFEMLFGWIPFLGKYICPRLDEVYKGKEYHLYVLVFVKES